MLLPEIITIVLKAAHNAYTMPNRTQLQKLLYFVTDKLGHAPIHRPHYYGPYSPDVSEATLDLVDMGVLDEDCRVSYGSLDATEIRQYSYLLSEKGKKVAELISEESPEDSEIISRLVGDLLIKSGSDTNTLAVAAKVHYILKRHKSIPRTDTRGICKQAARLGWEISSDDVTNAIELLVRASLLPNMD